MRPQGVGLKNHPHVPLLGLDENFLAFRNKAFVSQINLSAVRFLQAANQPQGGGLAAAAGAKESKKFAFANIQIEAIDGDDPVEGFGQTLNTQKTHVFDP